MSMPISERPSKQETGVNKLLAALIVDPWFLVFKLIAVVVGSAVDAVLKHRDRKKAKKAGKNG